MTRKSIPLPVSSMIPLSLGCEALGGTDWGDTNFKELRSAVKCAWEMGIRTFDTADVYGLGEGEEQLSKALGADRQNATIVTKVGLRWEGRAGSVRAKISRDSSPLYIRSAVEASLRR